MERRDIALGQWRKKKQTIAAYTNKGGNKNYVTDKKTCFAAEGHAGL